MEKEISRREVFENLLPEQVYTFVSGLQCLCKIRILILKDSFSIRLLHHYFLSKSSSLSNQTPYKPCTEIGQAALFLFADLSGHNVLEIKGLEHVFFFSILNMEKNVY